jgi:hypothetical protein
MKMRGIGKQRYPPVLFDSQVYCRISAMGHLGLSTGDSDNGIVSTVSKPVCAGKLMMMMMIARSRCDVTNKTK